MNFPWATAASLRMRLPRQLGYKNVKFLTAPDSHRQSEKVRHEAWAPQPW